jgi:S1-C subfamily serine protease
MLNVPRYMRVSGATCSVFALLALGVASAQAIDVGDVFWLSSSGAGLTVTGTALAQPGVVRVEYRLTLENASEYCQRYGQHARLTPQHDKCVAETIGSSRARTALVNCPAQVIVLESGSFAKGRDHFWRSRSDPNSFVLGDELFGRSCTRTAGTPTVPSVVPPAAATPSATGVAHGPSFDCTSKAASTQALAQAICRNKELAYWELSYVISYQALRESSLPEVRKAMVDEANALVLRMNDQCGLPSTGGLTAPPSVEQLACVRNLFQESRLILISRTVGPAREEATLMPPETVAIQRGLQVSQHLPATAAMDGVFGPVTRTAIASWQRENGLPATGFGSQALLQQMAGSASPPRTASTSSPSALPPMVEHNSVVDRSGRTNSIKLMLADGPELRPQEVFEKVSGAVYVVRAGTTLGSAVAIGERELLTNCHVVESAPAVTLEREGDRLPASVISANDDADRCILRASTQLRNWVKVRPYADVKVGERVYTVGAPRGLELSLAEGIISSKRALADGRHFQTSAPISKGSSGGGLFDAHGNLVGITTFMLKDSQNLNFAIAAEEFAK